jgi:hypothetical protein
VSETRTRCANLAIRRLALSEDQIAKEGELELDKAILVAAVMSLQLVALQLMEEN